MAERGKRDFCIACRRSTEYDLQKKNIVKKIKEKEYIFSVTTAICIECGEEMSLTGLIDKNVHEIDEQYRSMEGIVSVEDIEKLMRLYRIGKAPLSLALGFGEVTITRYLAGQIPSKEYSDILKSALSSPIYMKKCLKRNKGKIADAAYNKAMAAASQLEDLFLVSEKMLQVIAYVFERLEEVTPLMLQKLLYFIQGVFYVLHGRPMFVEDCEAWIHGPVYPAVYDLFRDFKYNPIEDARFAMFEGTKGELTEDERKVADLVVDSFGVYSGKVLEKITHNEEPWKIARRGYDDKIPSNELITKDSIKDYFTVVDMKYGIASDNGLKKYVQDMINKHYKNLFHCSC